MNIVLNTKVPQAKKNVVWYVACRPHSSIKGFLCVDNNDPSNVIQVLQIATQTLFAVFSGQANGARKQNNEKRGFCLEISAHALAFIVLEFVFASKFLFPMNSCYCMGLCGGRAESACIIRGFPARCIISTAKCHSCVDPR